MATLRLALSVALVAIAGCSPGDGALQVQWQFADGRDCETSGVRYVEVFATSGDRIESAAEFACDEGEVEPALLGGLPQGFYTLTALGRTADGAVLYAGEKVISVAADHTSTAEITLRWNDDRP